MTDFRIEGSTGKRLDSGKFVFRIRILSLPGLEIATESPPFGDFETEAEAKAECEKMAISVAQGLVDAMGGDDSAKIIPVRMQGKDPILFNNDGAIH